NLNNRQRDHGRPLKPQVLQPPLESATPYIPARGGVYGWGLQLKKDRFSIDKNRFLSVVTGSIVEVRSYEEEDYGRAGRYRRSSGLWFRNEYRHG
ncbi:hypothetical protein PMR98_10300, partial [Bifidobacterium longum]|nr:hypothetical protein [Bifidobacterium longum]MDB6801874.1 hypothetical protein [Bifidobacterium longum]